MHHRLGNIALIALLRSELNRFAADFPVLLKQVLYDGVHGETLRALDDLIRAGKVRYIGTSSFAAWQLVESLWVAKEYGLNRFICEQPAYNLLDRRVERELIPMAQTYGIAIIPWSPTAGGFLTGKYQRGAPLPTDSRFDAFWKGAEKEHFAERSFAVLDLVTALSQEKGCTPYQIFD